MSEIVLRTPNWERLKPWLWRALAVALVLVVVYLVREIWLPLGLAFLIALVLDPVVDRLERRGWSRTLGTAFIFGSFLLLLAGLLFLSVPPMVEQAGQIQQQIDRKFPDRSPAGIDKALTKQGVAPTLRAIIREAVTRTEGRLSRSSSIFTEKVVQFGSNLIWVAIVPIIAFYTLRDFHLILAKALLLVKRERRDLVQSAVAEVTAIFAKYMRGLLLVATLNGIATWLLLLVMGVPSSLVLGALAGVLYIVPYLGAIITVVLICGIALLAGGPNYMLLVLAANIVLHQFIFDQIITPRVVGGHVGLHPILAIIALLIGNALLGLVGMILAVPVAACLQIGVLALVPKLKQEIQLAPANGSEEVAHLSEMTKDRQLEVDATTELHQSVTEAVENIEAKLPEQEERRARILSRRKSRSSDSETPLVEAQNRSSQPPQP